MQTIRFDTNSPLATITLNRPDKRNALSPLMIAELTNAFTQASANPACRVVLLQAEGKAFCAGMDLDTLQQAASQSHEQNLADSRRLAALFQSIYESPKPVIAVVNGAALAGGCGLATVCDFTLAVPEAMFGYTEVKIGFIPAIVSVFLVRFAGEKRARELMLSARLFHASEALSFGLVTELVAADKIQARALELAATLAANSPQALAATKALLNKISPLDLEPACEANAAARQTPDCQEGVRAFLEKRKPNWI